MSEAADTPDFQMGNIQFHVFEDLEGGDIFWQRGGDCEIEEETCGQGSFTSVSRSGPVRFLTLNGPQPQPQPVLI